MISTLFLSSSFVSSSAVILLTATPYTSIGTLLGKKDHTTIMHGVNKITAELETNEELRNKVDIIIKKVNPPSKHSTY